MALFIRQLIAYFKAVFVEGINIIFTILNIITLISLFLLNNSALEEISAQLNRFGFVIIFFLFMVANFRAYQKLLILDSEKANIVLKATEIYFSPKRINNVDLSFVDKQGMPNSVKSFL